MAECIGISLLSTAFRPSHDSSGPVGRWNVQFSLSPANRGSLRALFVSDGLF